MATDNQISRAVMDQALEDFRTGHASQRTEDRTPGLRENFGNANRVSPTRQPRQGRRASR
jgi:hypothetical protein